MEISIRDINNQRGQGTVEYILVLVVTVGLILGGIYQLNSAFKSYANNYFGDYLSCLLESGELPTVNGTGGETAICDQLFKPFSLADGRRLKEDYKAPENTPTVRSGGGNREAGPAGSRVGGGGGSGGGTGRGFGNGTFGKPSRQTAGGGRGKKGASATFTGNMAASDYGSGELGRRRIPIKTKQSLDNKFAFQDDRERPQRKAYAGGGRRPAEEGSKAPSIRVKRTDVKKTSANEADTGLTLPNFLKWILIAGIVIALIVFLGGQGLQINKSME